MTDMDLACSEQKVDPRAGSEVCVASLQGLCSRHIYIVMNFMIIL